MSISGALSHAYSGLTAAARGAEVVSQNLANATTEGYGRREVQLSSRTLDGSGAGVRVEGIKRSVNEAVLSDRRLADASMARDETLRDFYASLETVIGQPGEPGSLSEGFAALESALVAAASRPDSTARLEAVADSATRLTAKFNDVSESIQAARMQADAEIALQVDHLNVSLKRIDELNDDIRAELVNGRDASAFMDERQRLIDGISEIVPLRQIARDGGQIALYSSGGAVLLDGRPSEFGFAPTPTIAPDMVVGGGVLSGLTLNGQPVQISAEGGLMGGGSLGAQFSIRDDLAPAQQSQLDALARDLIERFESPLVDPTLIPGAPGLFTDAGSALDVSAETGLASRLSLNTAVDPPQGGNVWRLRDGLGALSEGPVGQSSGLNALLDALTSARAPASGAYGGGLKSAAALGDAFLSGVGVQKQIAETDLAYASARLDALKSAELAEGVDTDAELQQLLVIEQAYAANARVITAADEMINRLLAI